MTNRRGSFAKRQREADLKERARAKQDRRNAKKGETRTGKGPEIADLAEVQAIVSSGGTVPVMAPPPAAPEAESNPDPADPRTDLAAPPAAAAPRMPARG